MWSVGPTRETACDDWPVAGRRSLRGGHALSLLLAAAPAVHIREATVIRNREGGYGASSSREVERQLCGQSGYLVKERV